MPSPSPGPLKTPSPLRDLTSNRQPRSRDKRILDLDLDGSVSEIYERRERQRFERPSQSPRKIATRRGGVRYSEWLACAMILTIFE